MTLPNWPRFLRQFDKQLWHYILVRSQESLHCVLQNRQYEHEQIRLFFPSSKLSKLVYYRIDSTWQMMIILRDIDGWLVHPPNIALKHQHIHTRPLGAMLGKWVKVHQPSLHCMFGGMVWIGLHNEWSPVKLNRNIELLIKGSIHGN